MVRGEHLQPQRITDLLGVQPSDQQVKGGPRGIRSSSGKLNPAKFGGWWLRLRENDSEDLHVQIDALLRQIKNPHVALDRVEHVEDAVLDVLFVECDLDSVDEELEITNEQVRALAELGLGVRITVSVSYPTPRNGVS